MKPTRINSFVFSCKAMGLRLKRAVSGPKAARGRRTAELTGTPVAAQSVTALWTAMTPDELELTAGKVENLRVALRTLDGVEFGPHEPFSFWTHLGRPGRSKGYVRGREIREGCVVPSVAGGLCQLSNALYDAALKAGFTILERHAHTRIIAGSLAEQGRDATVFWNYVDLRFSSPTGMRIEVDMTAADLVVRLRAPAQAAPSFQPAAGAAGKGPLFLAASCETCGVNDCFRHQELHTGARETQSRTAFLVDALWPEHDAFIQKERTERDLLLVPLDGKRRGKPNYAWTTGGFARVATFPWKTLLRSLASRRLAEQGAARQRALLAQDAEMAAAFARKLTPEVTHVVVAQNLLVPLFLSGALGGRTFDVLMHRLPLRELQKRLDKAHKAFPASKTLGDFRADAALVDAEARALARAKRLITPSASVAAQFPSRATKLDWTMPSGVERTIVAAGGRVLFPGPTAGRRGAYELREAARTLGLKLLLTGRDLEQPDGAGFWNHLDAEWVLPGTPPARALARAAVVVLPAHVDVSPRLLLRAVAMGIPVIASEACGLAGVPGVTVLEAPDAATLATALAPYAPAPRTASQG